VRRIAVMLILLLATPALGGQRAPRIELKVATTASKIKAFGSAKPPSDRKVRIRLAVLNGDVYETVATTRVRVRSDGSYIGSFARPATGNCRVRASYRGARHTIHLPCARPDFSTGTARLLGGDPPEFEIEVELAETSEQRSYGLMFRKRLAADRGMAFIWDEDQDGAFWMLNTLIPLSIAFYDAAGVIVSILDMEPCYDPPSPSECEIYDPETTFRGALEVNQGAFEEWGITEGDVITVSE
jgi:uncharacterized membrane protein (UPF0127 family)